MTISTSIYLPGEPIMAPVAGHTDLPMRLSLRRHSCKYAFTEMVDAGSLVYAAPKTEQLIARSPEEDFLGVQLVGSDIETLEKAIDILNTREFSLIDFNLGCPAPKVARKGEGATLALKNPDLALRAFSAMVKRSRFPVSAKMRILSEEDPTPTLALARGLEEAGACALTIHGRLLHKFYSGPVFFDIIKAIKDTLHIPVIANGGALSAPLYHELLEKTTCQNGMIARGALGNPWIFREIRGGLPPTIEEFTSEMREHFFAMVDFYGEELAVRISRKTLLAYLHGRGFPGRLRAAVSTLGSVEEFNSWMAEIEKGPVSREYARTGFVSQV